MILDYPPAQHLETEREEESERETPRERNKETERDKERAREKEREKERERERYHRPTNHLDVDDDFRSFTGGKDEIFALPSSIIKARTPFLATAFERTGNTLIFFEDHYPKATARIWP